MLFLAAILLAPIAGVIPGADTSPALVLIGMLMIHSVADGIGVGFIAYTAISLVSGKGRKIPPVTYILTVLFIAMYVLSAI